MLSLIVAKKFDLEFMPFLILCRDINFSINFRLGKFFVATKQKLSRQKFVYAPVDLCRNIKKSCRDMFYVRCDIKELCCNKLFLVKSNVSTNFVPTETKCVAT